MNTPTAPHTLPDDVVAHYTKEAKKEGLFAGLASGLASAVLGGRLLGLNRNKTLLSGVPMVRAHQSLQTTPSSPQNGKSGESA
ncbi:hypothetical protein PTI98_001956 [Pleurotus ostreatus]|nr:hypothetical protein PTI98_001956 [Pleurotus ostreatus]